MNNQYHATPYDISATGFYFSDYEEYCTKAATHKNAYGQPVEEYEIQFIDGENCELFNALDISQATLKLWFEAFEALDDETAVKAIYLANDEGIAAENIEDELDNYCFFEGTAKDYAEDYLDQSGILDEVPESLRYYIDSDALARDMQLNGDVNEATIDGKTYVVWRC